MKDSEPHIVAFTAGKGGCGKTTLAINFADIVTKSKHNVLLIDLDIHNQGSTGILQDFISNDPKYLTLDSILKVPDFKDFIAKGKLNKILGKDNYFFLPAIKFGDVINPEEYEKEILILASFLKNIINEIKKKDQIDCVILDCFCGMDNLTTAGALIANDAILINEPDVVTFTGTMNLLYHLKNSLAELRKKPPEGITELNPKFHSVINRLKFGRTVIDLDIIYKNNLIKEFNEKPLVHFPYNEKIFKNFGKWPFWNDLLPHSVFVKKLELLCLKIFKPSEENLIPVKVNNWSNWKANKIYKQSVDYSSIDNQFLITRISNFLTQSGILISIFFVVSFFKALTPSEAAIFTLVLLIALVFIFMRNFIWPAILSTWFNFNLFKFEYRLNNKLHWLSKKLKTDRTNIFNFYRPFSNLFNSFFMALASIALFAFIWWSLLTSLYTSEKYVSNQSFPTPDYGLNLNNYLHHVLIQNAMEGYFFRNMNFTNDIIEGIPSSLPKLYPIKNTRLRYDGTKFINCSFSSDFFNDSFKFKRTTFSDCEIYSDNSNQNIIQFIESIDNTSYKLNKGQKEIIDTNIRNSVVLLQKLFSVGISPTYLFSNYNFKNITDSNIYFSNGSLYDNLQLCKLQIFNRCIFDSTKFYFNTNTLALFINCKFISAKFTCGTNNEYFRFYNCIGSPNTGTKLEHKYDSIPPKLLVKNLIGVIDSIYSNRTLSDNLKKLSFAVLENKCQQSIRQVYYDKFNMPHFYDDPISRAHLIELLILDHEKNKSTLLSNQLLELENNNGITGKYYAQLLKLEGIIVTNPADASIGNKLNSWVTMNKNINENKHFDSQPWQWDSWNSMTTGDSTIHFTQRVYFQIIEGIQQGRTPTDSIMNYLNKSSIYLPHNLFKPANSHI